MTVEIIQPHGFCMGVERALTMAAGLRPPVFCLHEIVHNEHVVESLRERGMVFVESLDEVPDGSMVLFSAHGVAPSVRAEAVRRGLSIVDATCPFVERVHRAARAFAARGVPVVLIGRANHAEVRGIAGELSEFRVVASADEAAGVPFPPDSPLGVLCQTTMSHSAVCSVLDALRRRYSRLETPPAAEICTATRDRQRAVADFVRAGGDGVLVLGSAGSSNTNRLVDVAREAGAAFAFRAGSMDEIRALDFAGVRRLGVTAGASTPEDFLAQTVGELRTSRACCMRRESKIAT